MASIFSKFKKEKKNIMEVCQNNIDRFFDEYSILQIEQYVVKNKVKIKEYECLNHCKDCKKMPYIQINGETIFKPTVKEILEELEGK